MSLLLSLVNRRSDTPVACRTSECNVTSYDLWLSHSWMLQGPSRPGGTFSGSDCITSQWGFSEAGQGAMNDELETIRRVLAADVESFRPLVERYQRPLLTLIRNLTPPDTDHEGVGQEVFLAAFRSLASFDPNRSAFSTWLFTIARSRCRNELAPPAAGRGSPTAGRSSICGRPSGRPSEAELFRRARRGLGRPCRSSSVRSSCSPSARSFLRGGR